MEASGPASSEIGRTIFALLYRKSLIQSVNGINSGFYSLSEMVVHASTSNTKVTVEPEGIL